MDLEVCYSKLERSGFYIMWRPDTDSYFLLGPGKMSEWGAHWTAVPFKGKNILVPNWLHVDNGQIMICDQPIEKCL